MSVNNTDALKALLSAAPRPQKTVKIPRLGVDFTVRAISVNERESIREQASYPVKGGGTRLDANKFASLIIVKGTVDPDFSAPELIAAYGPTPADVPVNVLLPGEYDRLFGEILAVSGIAEDEDAAIEDAKN